MNRPTDHERLLADALTDAAPPGFREALLDATLRRARRRRRLRHMGRAAMALAALGLTVILVRQAVLPGRAPAHPAAARYTMVRTHPLPASAIVITQPLSPRHRIASATSVEFVQTTSESGGFRVLNDDELLGLVSSRPAALVRLGPGSEQLVFVNPEDQAGFPVN